MNRKTRSAALGDLRLWAETAKDLMTPNPVSIRADATADEAVALLIDKGVGAVPVIDSAGRPVGVLSRSDALVHQRETVDGAAKSGVPAHTDPPTTAADLMTPGVLAVTSATPAAEVIEQMLGFRVHHIFVADHDGTLVGVVSPIDVLRRLKQQPAPVAREAIPEVYLSAHDYW